MLAKIFIKAKVVIVRFESLFHYNTLFFQIRYEHSHIRKCLYLTLNRGLGSFKASEGISMVPHLYASSALLRFQASKKSVAHTMLKILKANMHQSRVFSPRMLKMKVTMPRNAGAISHLVYIPSQAKYIAILTPKY